MTGEPTTTVDVSSDMSGPSFDFTVVAGDRRVPATFWHAREPKGADTPLTLLQHGGPFHRRHERSADLARTVVAQTDSAVLLIDGPIHGERRIGPDLPVGEMLAEFKAFWTAEPGIDDYVADWRAAIDAVVAQGWADPTRIAWFGMSMGTAYGLALCAAEPRIAGAALGMWGSEWGQVDALLAAARAMATPVLFQIKDADEIFGIPGQRAIFDAIGSRDKALRTHAGGHNLTAPGQMAELLDFIARAQRGTEAELVD